ncbi:MAG TPA: hypothetical protein PKY78_06550 [Candidatus Omnitrophota bacterium]|nr:hypothetical protein [Candidatus Omnitrophota bacterium]
MTDKPSPIPLTMVICDTVIDDRKTGKKSLIGLFNNINAEKVPFIHSRMNVFICLTEGVGDYAGRLRCINMNTEKILFEMNGNVHFTNPHQVVEFDFELCGLNFPQFGEYRFELLCNDKLVIARQFKITENLKGSKPANPET